MHYPRKANNLWIEKSIQILNSTSSNTLKFNNVDRHLNIQLWSSEYLKTYSYIALQLEPVLSPHLLEQLQKNSIQQRYCSTPVHLLWSHQSRFIMEYETEPLETAALSVFSVHSNCLHFEQSCLFPSSLHLPYVHTLIRIFHHHYSHNNTLSLLKSIIRLRKSNRSSGKIQLIPVFSPITAVHN